MAASFFGSKTTTTTSYDVFLSFRGTDTRQNFTVGLYNALKLQGIYTFIDDNGIERGEDIKSELQKGIRHSRMSVIVLSRNYATSGWCLDELVLIFQRYNTAGHVILPIFYHVEKSLFTGQVGSVAEAFACHEERFKGEKSDEKRMEGLERMKGWKAALRQVVELGGMTLKAQADHEGEDTRKTFTSHLHTALIQAGFRTFLDDDGLSKGEDLKSEITKAISESKCSIVIMSSGYSSSRWCLDELVMILEHKRRKGHVVLPVYHDVEPTDVRKQSGRLGEAFACYEMEVEHETDSTRKTELADKIKQWREALREVADLAGMVLKDQVNGQESKFIQKIVEVIRGKLNLKVLSMTPYTVGMQSRLEEINLWLQNESTDVSILIISGIGGIGKTTIAKSVYNLNFERFEGSSFLANVRETSMQPNGLVRLQRQLLSDITNVKFGKINNVDEGVIKIQDLLRYKRFFLVLDDVDRVDQLDAVFGMRNWFSQGSKIIITTRNQCMLQIGKTCEVHRVQELDTKQSLNLFSIHAFGHENPADDYLKLSQQIVNHCGGLPLALQVIGSSLSGKSVDVWGSALRKLELFPDTQIVNKLQISYDSLQDDHDRDLFLHIAFFFIGKDKDFAKGVLDAWGFCTAIGIESLIDGYLLRIEEPNKFGMHQLLQDMARDIVRRESPKEPGKRSRLWNHQDSFDVLRDKSGTEAVEGLCLDMHVLQNQKSYEGVSNVTTDMERMNKEVVDESVWQGHGSSNKQFQGDCIFGHQVSSSSKKRRAEVLRTSAFEGMHRLRILLLNQVEFTGNFTKFPKRLKWLKWLRYPHTSIPAEFLLGELVVLDLRYSSLKNVFKGIKVLGSLKFLNLGHSHSLSRTPDFNFLPSLKSLILKDCISLIEIHESIECLRNLVFLNLRGCKNLSKLPWNIGKLISLETLIISGCTKVDNLPKSIVKLESLKVLHADDIDLSHLPSSTKVLRSWRAKIFGRWRSKEKMIQGVSQLYLPQCLVRLSLVNCNLSETAFPKDWRNLSLLRKLDLSKNPIRCLPDCIRSLKNLEILLLNSCVMLESLLQLPKLEWLDVASCSSLQDITYLPPDCFPKRIHHRHCIQLSEIEGIMKLEHLSEMNGIGFVLEHVSYRPDLTPFQVLNRRIVASVRVPGEVTVSGLGFPELVSVIIKCRMKINWIEIYCAYTLSKDYKEVISEHPFVSFEITNLSKNLTWTYNETYPDIPEDKEEMIWRRNLEIGHHLAIEDKNEVRVTVYIRNLEDLSTHGHHPPAYRMRSLQTYFGDNDASTY